jgi:hypothetical protein
MLRIDPFDRLNHVEAGTGPEPQRFILFAGAAENNRIHLRDFIVYNSISPSKMNNERVIYIFSN